ncbi:MAG TPA: hypothetical protein PK804_01210 [Candidatus Dojkabacteria bacterium]|nr:hypothetical protein [Candidatus Dojkabacteria bacterium]
MSQVISSIENFVRMINPFLGLMIIFFVGMYVFWKEASRSRKNNSSVFDSFLFSVLFGIIIGRIVYIVLDWNEFSSYTWYWLPYERYGDQIYMFRLLPWRFLRIWDGQLDVLFTFIGLLFSQTFFITFFKKWKWSDLFSAQYYSNWLMIGLIYIFIGILNSNKEWIQYAWWILIPFSLMLLLQFLILKFADGKKKENQRVVLNSIFALFAVTIISYVFYISSPKITTIVGIVALIIWYVVGIALNLSGQKRADNVTIERVSSVRQISLPEVRKPIRLPR